MPKSETWVSKSWEHDNSFQFLYVIKKYIKHRMIYHILLNLNKNINVISINV